MKSLVQKIVERFLEFLSIGRKYDRLLCEEFGTISPSSETIESRMRELESDGKEERAMWLYGAARLKGITKKMPNEIFQQ